ncbi:ankyrin repeat domain-containing protein 63-like [Lineus longissimus]|uniref:ankyrin repeat domain-containing protein 63-like n=1 Tax=Lineus longissimus TaxID=88925 RepID=UPI00315D12CC
MSVMSRRGTNPEPEASGGSALLDAINRNKIHLAKFILDAVDHEVVNCKDFKGKTPLIRSVYIKEERTRAKAINLLLQKKADVNMRDDAGRTALSYACEQRCNDVVQILVKNNVDPDLGDNDGNTPLIYSAMVGNDKAIELLLKSFRRLGLDVDRTNKAGLTAMLVAAKHGYISCATLLSVEGGASVGKTDPEKHMTAEDWARTKGCSTPEVLPFSTAAPHPRKRRRKKMDASAISLHSRSKTSLKDGDITKRKHSHALSRSQPTNSLRQVTPRTGTATDYLMETLTDLRISSTVPAPLPPPLARIGIKQTDVMLHRQKSPKINLHGCHYDAKSVVPQLTIQKAPTVRGHVSPSKRTTQRPKQSQTPSTIPAEHPHLKREKQDKISVLISQLTFDAGLQKKSISDDEAYISKPRKLGPVRTTCQRPPELIYDSDSSTSSLEEGLGTIDARQDYAKKSSGQEGRELGLPSGRETSNSSC